MLTIATGSHKTEKHSNRGYKPESNNLKANKQTQSQLGVQNCLFKKTKFCSRCSWLWNSKFTASSCCYFYCMFMVMEEMFAIGSKQRIVRNSKLTAAKFIGRDAHGNGILNLLVLVVVSIIVCSW